MAFFIWIDDRHALFVSQGLVGAVDSFYSFFSFDCGDDLLGQSRAECPISRQAKQPLCSRSHCRWSSVSLVAVVPPLCSGIPGVMIAPISIGDGDAIG